MELTEEGRPAWSAAKWLCWEVNGRPTAFLDHTVSFFPTPPPVTRLIGRNEEICWDTIDLTELIYIQESAHFRILSWQNRCLVQPGKYEITMSPSPDWGSHRFRPVSFTVEVK